jgi:hypothetical protein
VARVTTLGRNPHQRTRLRAVLDNARVRVWKISLEPGEPTTLITRTARGMHNRAGRWKFPNMYPATPIAA